MKDDRLYLINISESIERIESVAKEGRDAFMASWVLQNAVIREFEIIGEATKRLSNDLKNAHPVAPWKRIAGFRDVLIHDYLGVDLNEVWNIVARDLPELKRKIKSIV